MGNLPGKQLIGAVKTPSESREIGEGIVYRVLLHVGREAPDYLEHSHRKETVGLVVHSRVWPRTIRYLIMSDF